MLLINGNTEVPQFLPYGFFLCAWIYHPVIVIVMVDQPGQEPLVVWVRTAWNSGVRPMPVATNQQERSASC
jgi:hypothetical protein